MCARRWLRSASVPSSGFAGAQQPAQPAARRRCARHRDLGRRSTSRAPRAAGRSAPIFPPSAARPGRPTSFAATPSARPAASRRCSCRRPCRPTRRRGNRRSSARSAETAVGRDDEFAHDLHQAHLGQVAGRHRPDAAAVRAQRQRMAAGGRGDADRAAAVARRRIADGAAGDRSRDGAPRRQGRRRGDRLYRRERAEGSPGEARRRALAEGDGGRLTTIMAS